MGCFVDVLEQRLLRMRAEGASIERQQCFASDAIALNRRQAAKIRAMVQNVAPELSVGKGNGKAPAKRARPSERCPQVLKERLSRLRGSMEFWYLAVSLKAEVRREALTKEENSEVTALRASAIQSGDVCALLGLSIDKLNGLDQGGRLPHRFKRRMEVKGHVVMARCWLLCDVHAFSKMD